MSTRGIAARVPLRVSFAGGGTDIEPYPSTYGGAVLAATIGTYVHVDLFETVEDGIKFNSIDLGHESKFDLFDKEQILNKSLFGACLAEFVKEIDSSLSISVRSPVPPGSGLGASSSITLAILATLRRKYFEDDNDNLKLAFRAYVVERERLGIPGGIQDQYACAFGGINFIEFSSPSDVTINKLNVNNDFLLELEHDLLLLKVPGARISDGILEEQGRALNKTVNLENYHIQKSIAHKMYDAFQRCDLASIGELLNEGWKYKKHFSKKISNPLIDNVYEVARNAGAIGGKLLGAGGGGHMLFLCPRTRRHEILNAVNIHGFIEHPLTFANDGIQTWESNY